MREETLMAKKKSMDLFQTVEDVLESVHAPDCQACNAEQRQTVATWVCHHCSDGRRRMLLCEACMMDEHEDYYADEIVY